jgi:hypothetical protein
VFNVSFVLSFFDISSAFSAFSAQDDGLPALFGIGPGVNLGIFLRRSLRPHEPKESKPHPGPPNSGLALQKFGFRRISLPAADNGCKFQASLQGQQFITPSSAI